MKPSQKVKEELQALVASEGWRIFTALVEENYGDTAVVGQLMQRAEENGDIAALGMHTAATLSTQKALRNVLALPAYYIQQMDGIEEDV